MKKITKVLWVILAILIIIFAGNMLAKYIHTVQTNANNINQNTINEIVNQVRNNIKNEIHNQIDEKVQNEIENIIENTITNDVEENEDEENQKEPETNGAQTGEDDRQKAINMAKKEWGEDENVSFKIDEQTENGKFVVSVVDKSTTKVIFWYSVDVKNNTIEEK